MVILNPPLGQNLPEDPRIEEILPVYYTAAEKLKNDSGKSMVEPLFKDILQNSFDKEDSPLTPGPADTEEKEELVDNDKSLEEEAPFRITALSGKGSGMIARRNLFPGDLILAEKPLLFLPDKIYEDVELAEENIDKQVLLLTSEERESLFELTDSRSPLDPTYLGIFYTNDMNYDGDATVSYHGQG